MGFGVRGEGPDTAESKPKHANNLTQGSLLIDFLALRRKLKSNDSQGVVSFFPHVR